LTVALLGRFLPTLARPIWPGFSLAMMDLANMRQNGVRHVTLWCVVECGHRADILVDELPDETLVREIGQRYRCSKCGRPSPESRPAWHLGAFQTPSR
jgi:hypothetical protein